jgi:hypothetical protein
LVAEGDSWFDYPFFDTLEELEDRFGYRIESVAHKGDTIEDMAYASMQLDALHRRLRRVRDDNLEPRAILLSGGGNDIAGTEFPVLLNHRNSGVPGFNEMIVSGLFDDRLRYAAVALARAVTRLCEDIFAKTIPLLIHGYDYPVPDGRGYFGGMSILPGPWLAPGFRRKGYEDLAEGTRMMEVLIDRYNDVLKSVAGGPGLDHLSHVDLRGTLSNALPKAYRTWWDNELHPTKRGFGLVAERIHTHISALA